MNVEHRPHTPRRTLGIAAVGLSTALALSACSGSGEQPAASDTAAPAASESVAPSTEATPTTTAKSTEHSTSAAADKGVAKVKKRFGSIAPDSLWEQFDTCDSTGLDNAYECSVPAVGQFQLFDSKSKAASTTQVLEELRSSTVLEDNGRYIVGWSTLGTSAVITVVDNEEGLVMQQLVSSDIVDPEEHIKKLGLTLPPGDEKDEKATDESAPKETSEEQKPAH